MLDYMMSAPSLFPLVGRIEKLKGFFPEGYRDWFVVFSTVFSMIVYSVIQFQFEELPFLLPPYYAIIAAVVSLIIYLLIHLDNLNRVSSLPKRQKSLLMIVQLLLYCFFIVSLTYVFNYMENTRNHDIYNGVITYETGGAPKRINSRADIKIRYKTVVKENSNTNSGSVFEEETIKSRKNGRYTLIVNSDKKRLWNIRVRWCRDNSRECYHLDKNSENLSKTGEITLARTGE